MPAMRYFIFTRSSCTLDWFVLPANVSDLTPEQVAATLSPEGYSNLFEVSLQTIQEVYKNAHR